MQVPIPPVWGRAARPSGYNAPMRRALPLLPVALSLACTGADDAATKDTRDPTGDSAGDTGDTGDSGHTGDSGDSGDTGDSGDPGPAPALTFTGARPTNLLVISLDTTRRDQLGVFSGLDTTPFWDGVLGESVLLADHVTCSNWTAPSMMATG